MGTVVSISLACDPGEMILAGGTENFTNDPDDQTRIHMLDSGPDDLTGWHADAVVTQQFSNGGTLEVVLTILCVR